MKGFDITKAAKLLPKGTVSNISFDTRISQSVVSKILNGKKSKEYLTIEKEVIKKLSSVKEEISCILKNINNGKE